MKKWILVGVVVIAFVVFAVYQRVHNTQPSSATTTAITEPATTTSSDSTTDTDTSAGATPLDSTPTPVATPVTTPTPVTSTGEYKDGTYTGSVANAFYGNIQVAATISGGKLSDVQFLQYPNDRGESVQVNTSAMPKLKSEAISAQSAQVNVVSGATQTSQAFIESLGNALAQAKA